VYFHDTDLGSARRRRALVATLAMLGRRRRAVDLDQLAHACAGLVPEVPFDRVYSAGNAAAGQ